MPSGHISIDHRLPIGHICPVGNKMEEGVRPLSRDMDKIITRLPEGMREKLKTAADANRRSVNAQVVFILEDYLKATGGGAANHTPAAPDNAGG